MRIGAETGLAGDRRRVRMKGEAAIPAVPLVIRPRDREIARSRESPLPDGGPNRIMRCLHSPSGLVSALSSRVARAPLSLLSLQILLLPGLLLLISGATPGVAADSGLVRSERPEEAELYFITPRDGDRVSSPVTVRFGLAGMGVS